MRAAQCARTGRRTADLLRGTPIGQKLQDGAPASRGPSRGNRHRAQLLLPTLTAVILLFQFSCRGGFSGRVVGVTDGDTFTILHGGKSEKVRLNGIDCPEKGQPFGAKAKQFTSDLIFDQQVFLRTHGKDRYGRWLVDAILPDGRCLNRELLRSGYAWWYRRYSSDKELEALESEARLGHRGLWAAADPIAPWDWRSTSHRKTQTGKP